MNQIDRIAAQALERSPEDRASFVAEACGGDADLRSSVETLLEAHRQSAELFGAPVDAYASDLWEDFLDDVLTEEEASAGEAGMRVGAYRLVEELGRGGMGAVFLAERADGQFEQEVAVKLIRRRKTGASVVRRFLAERQILATLRHPNIANLYDGGVTEETGLPYLVMEYVEGEPITVYIERGGLLEDDRLRLFEAVCEAVQVAHGNLVVHRDLKPSNILVTEDGQVKLLDFGIAKFLEEEEPSDGSLASIPDQPAGQTTIGGRVMTPAYAAPEQLRGETVTTATDVYQLGVLLREILTCDSAGMQRGRMGVKESGTTRERGKGRKPEEATCHPELQSIVEKAMQEAPSNRYRSVEALLADIRRYRERQPVQAHAGALPYRARKFVQRHRLSVAAAAVALVSLVGGLGAALWQAQRATDNALRATDERDKAEEVTAFLMGLFEANDPGVAQGDTLTARELLEQGVAHAEALDGRPELQATLYQVTGKVFYQLDNMEEAEELYRRALTVWEDSGLDTQQKDEHDQVLLSLGYVLFFQSRYQEAENVYRQVLRRRASQGIEDEIRRDALFALFEVLHSRGRTEAANDVFVAWREANDANPPDASDLESAERMVRVAEVFGYRGDIRGDLDAILRGQTLVNNALKVLRKTYGSRHPRVGNALNMAMNLVITEMNVHSLSEDKLAWADTMSHENVRLHRTIYPEYHFELWRSVTSRSTILRKLERYDEAEALAREAMDIAETTRGRDHVDWIVSLKRLAHVLNARGDYEQAITHFQEARDSWARRHGPEYWFTLNADLSLAEALIDAERFEEANERLLTTYEVLDTSRGRSDNLTQRGLELLVNLYEAWGKPDEAAVYRARLAEE